MSCFTHCAQIGHQHLSNVEVARQLLQPFHAMLLTNERVKKLQTNTVSTDDRKQTLRRLSPSETKIVTIAWHGWLSWGRDGGDRG